MAITRDEFADLLIDKNEKWVARKFAMSPHEWEYLGWLAEHWFNSHRRKKWALARLIDEVRIAFCPPPLPTESRRKLEIREGDLAFVHGLKSLLGFDSTTGVIRAFMYMMNTAPICMFPDPRDYWEEPQSLEDCDFHSTHWAQKVMTYIKKRRGNKKEIRNKLQEVWHTCRLPKSRRRLSSVRMRQLQTFHTIDRERHLDNLNLEREMNNDC